jgi:NADPH:quinone reductase-like Zn-dependent oxidoreductase
MRAVLVRALDGSDAITVGDRPVRDPGNGEVRLRVSAAAVNPADVVMWQTLGQGVVPLPFTPGMDVAGTVESLGPDVKHLSLGQQVMAVVNPRRPVEGGGQAELVLVPATWVVPAPNGISLPEAATLPMNGLTALQGLHILDLPEGATLGVTGGAGHLASLTIALAKARGLSVVADASAADADLVRSFGADHVVTRGAFAEAVRQIHPGGIDAVIDTAAITRAAVPPIRTGGQIAVVRGWDDQGEPGRAITAHPISVGNAIGNTSWLQSIADEAAAGHLPLRVGEILPAHEALAAYRMMKAGGLRGRIVLTF